MADEFPTDEFPKNEFPKNPVSGNSVSGNPVTDDFDFSQFSYQAVDDRHEEGDVIIASRIQLHRNIAEHPFVGVSSEDQLDEVRGSLLRCIERNPQLEEIPVANSEQLREIERQFLSELRSVINAADKLADPISDDPSFDVAAPENFDGEANDESGGDESSPFGPSSDVDTVFGEFSNMSDSSGKDLEAGLFQRLESEDRMEALFLQQIAHATSVATSVVSHEATSTGAGTAGISDEDFADVTKIPTHEISTTINDEDHLRLQVMAAGCPMDWMWRRISEIDDRFESSLSYAYSPQWGYLSASPANVGTGMRVTVLLHLPALATLGRLENAFLGLMREGIVGRGLYGEEAWGDFFRIGNQVTLGMSEENLIQLVCSVVPSIVAYERGARQLLMQQYEDELTSQVSDAQRGLKLAVRRDDKEWLSLISSVRLGISLGLISRDEAVELHAGFELTRLKRKLEIAVKMEHYSSATRYRDQIRQLEHREYGH